MSFADELARRRAEVAAEAAEAEADNDIPPFFGLRPRFTAVRPERIDGGGPWFVELVAELVRHPQVFTEACLARRLDDVTYECVDNDTWEQLLREPILAEDRKEKRAAQARVQRIWKYFKSGELVEIGHCRIPGYGFRILDNGLVESTATLRTAEWDEVWAEVEHQLRAEVPADVWTKNLTETEALFEAEIQADIRSEAIELIVKAESAG